MSASAPPSPVPHGLEVLRTYGEGFAGREAELAALDQAWNEGIVRVFVLHAEGGAGKTRVVAKWLTRMRDDGWRGARRVFVHSFYSQGSDERRNASSELFFEQALDHFGYAGPRLTDPREQGRTLARLLVEQHGLLVLDGIESLQHPPTFDQGRLKDPAIYSLLLSLAAGRIGDPAGGGLCVVTSRQSVQELSDKIGRTIIQQPLDRLDAVAGAELLKQLEVRGPERELREAVGDAHGHAYSLMLLGTYLRDATDDHEIRRRREIPLLDEDAEHRYHARHLFGAYVRHLGENSPEVAVLRLLGFFDRPAEERLLVVLREAADPEFNALTAPLQNLSDAGWRRVLRRLTDLRLIDIVASPSPPIDSHPLLRDYFAEQLRTRFSAAWQAGHRRLFEHLCKTIERWPDTLTGLQQLYLAVTHGCVAGLHEKALVVYTDRIQRRDQQFPFYSTKKFGLIGADLGAVACFFETPWNILAPGLELGQSWLLNEAAVLLHALGRLSEAADPLKVELDICVRAEDWKGAATSASDLCELELTRGNVQAAVAAGEQSVTYSDRAGENEWEIFVASRTQLAHALHQAGRRAESRSLFEDAESRQAAQPWFISYQTELYWERGFKYCELLLSAVERIVWQCFLWSPSDDPIGRPSDILMDSIAVCRTVIERATIMLEDDTSEWVTSLLYIALDRLILGRAKMYEASLAFLKPQTAVEHVTAAVLGLRASGDLRYLPLGLLLFAWLRFQMGDEPECRDYLDQAWEIAERGPMPLFQADILLYRARLFHDDAALAEARGLIGKHGYHRRDEELADAEEAAQRWDCHPPSSFPISTPVSSGEGATLPKSEGSMRDQVFISYSHPDKKLMEEFLTHLKPYLRTGSVRGWCDKDIVPGSKWFDKVQVALSRTSVAVLLVSPDFLASDFIHDHELTPLLREAEAGGVTIMWVPLRPSAYQETPLKDYQAAFPPDRPLAQMSKANRDAAWHKICEAIKSSLSVERTVAPLTVEITEKSRMDIQVQLSAENGPGKALVRVENLGEKAVFSATARVTDVRERVNNPKFLQTYGLRWSSNGRDELTIGTGAAGSLLIASTGKTITQTPSGRDLLELLLEGYADGQPSKVDWFRWHAGDQPGAVTICLDVTVSSSMASGVLTRGFIVTSREWGGVLIEEGPATSNGFYSYLIAVNDVVR